MEFVYFKVNWFSTQMRLKLLKGNCITDLMKLIKLFLRNEIKNESSEYWPMWSFWHCRMSRTVSAIICCELRWEEDPLNMTFLNSSQLCVFIEKAYELTSFSKLTRLSWNVLFPSWMNVTSRPETGTLLGFTNRYLMPACFYISKLPHRIFFTALSSLDYLWRTEVTE